MWYSPTLLNEVWIRSWLAVKVMQGKNKFFVNSVGINWHCNKLPNDQLKFYWLYVCNHAGISLSLYRKIKYAKKYLKNETTKAHAVRFPHPKLSTSRRWHVRKSFVIKFIINLYFRYLWTVILGGKKCTFESYVLRSKQTEYLIPDSRTRTHVFITCELGEGCESIFYDFCL